MKKRIATLVLALLLCLSMICVSACNKTPSGDGKGTQDNGENTTEPTTGGEEEKDPLEYYKTTFGNAATQGKEIWIYDLNTSPASHINYFDDYQGDPMNVALYERDMMFEEYYGVVFEYFQNTAGSKVISNSVLGGSYVADIIYGRASGDRLMTLAQQDCLMDMRSMEELDFSQAWWGNFISDSLTVNNRLFFTSGDILPSFYQSIGCFFYNIDLGDDYSIDKDAICNTVESGNWTWEYINGLVKDANRNLDSNEELTADVDQFGLITYNVYNHTNMFAIGAGLKLCQETEAGEWIVDFESTAVVEKLGKLKNYMTTYSMGEHGVDSIMGTTFKEGRAIFAEHFTESAFNSLKDMENDYLMLPVPKLEASQDNYRCMVNSYVNCFVGVLSNCADEKVTGIILESMAYAGYNDIRPIAYEEALKGRLARDPAAIDMVDLIFDTAYIDYGVIEKFGVSTEYKEGVSTILYKYLKEDGELSSAFAANKDAINGALKTALKNFLEIE